MGIQEALLGASLEILFVLVDISKDENIFLEIICKKIPFIELQQ